MAYAFDLTSARTLVQLHDKRLNQRYWKIVKQHYKHAPTLAVIDWSMINYYYHESKTDRLERTHLLVDTQSRTLVATLKQKPEMERSAMTGSVLPKRIRRMIPPLAERLV